MKAKTLLLMGVAIMCGLVASYMTSRLIAEKNETVKVLVATRDVPEWTPLRSPELMFVEKDVLKSQTPPTYVPPAAIGEMKDRLLIKRVRKDEPVTWDALQGKDKMGLEALLPSGMRAFAIEANARTAAGGFVLPGSHVDILVTSRGQLSDSKYVLENVLVRAVDLIAIRPDDRAGVLPSTITIQVTPEQVLKISKVSASGPFMLSLRPFHDTSIATMSIGELPTPPPPIDQPVVAVNARLIPDKEPNRFFYQTGYDGQRWVRIKYTLDLTGNVIKTPEYMAMDSADNAAGPKATPATADSDQAPPAPGVAN